MRWLVLRVGLIVVAGAAGAAETPPYAGWQKRSIEALAPHQIEQYQRLREYVSSTAAGGQGHN